MTQQIPPDPDSTSKDGLRKMILRLPTAISEVVKDKTAQWTNSSKLREERLPLDWNEAAVNAVKAEIEDLLRRKSFLGGIAEPWTEAELKLAEEITDATRKAEISNITRTQAYWQFYEQYPELHWAFLAHMVSRNAGWWMTDLKGSRLQNVFDEAGKQSFYRFFERSNALIFQDAFPQLLLYAKSREMGRSLFHLLPHFHVSRFMQPFWERFWIDRSSPLLTVGLIINEQNYIDKQVFRHPHYQISMGDFNDTAIIQLLGMNHIIFPLLKNSGDEDGLKECESAADGQDCPESGEVHRLAGRSVVNPVSLPARIALGKSLYAMLFGLRAVHSGAQRFAASVPHTGSRADYWPDLFTANPAEALTNPAQGSELAEGETLPGGQRLYSPKLTDAWGDAPYEPILREDWFKDPSALNGISAPQSPYLCDISREHRYGITKAALPEGAAD
ncbi:DUF2515 domain-containing protein [Paenibacillus motobuensis]|uniref:DUF2515 family protein n=1 Tax=Paenibacillus TaxID=44249 RepID=UPI00203EBF58|nr:MULTISPECIES: DUF2515 family protein [Paenibacillus]MCM3041786.1 DUF2515 domain-containing protein [Paenibacillus lutimineralis]MCM3648890.1 DUF2515 domain-containing protein [Paenibacillus motobuensis]